MLLCDIGNSFAHFFDNKKVWTEDIDKFINNHKDDKVYYINVNEKVKSEILSLKNWVNLENFIEFKTKYKNLGIDRKVACMSVKDGVVVDAGSAITVDLMERGAHLGGFIMPGFKATKDALKNISSKLDQEIDFDLDINKIPLNTKEAVSYGLLKPVVLAIKDFSKGKKIYLTGGDGKKLSRFFKNSVYDDKLIFKGMIKIVKEKL